MVTEVLMPKWGWEMTEGMVTKWLKNDGEKVEKGDPLVEIETYKVTDEVEAPESGILRIIAPEESFVPVRGVLATIIPLDEAAVFPAIKQEAKVKRIKISPRARKIAEKFGIDIQKIKGTGPRGRIVKRDILRVVEKEKELAKVAPEITFHGKVIPLTGIRKIIADRMSRSARTTARTLHTIEVDMTKVVRLRAEIESKAPLHVSYTPILVKAAAKALEIHSIINSVLLEDGIHVVEKINTGVAVYVKGELVVPVIHDANKKSIIEIAQRLNQLVERAEQGTLSAEDTTNGTFTITNPGMYGIDIQMPIINPPESAILGVGTIKQRPVVIDSQIKIRHIMNLSLCFDHRVIDGVPADKFLQSLKGILENPFSVLV